MVDLEVKVIAEIHYWAQIRNDYDLVPRNFLLCSNDSVYYYKNTCEALLNPYRSSSIGIKSSFKYADIKEWSITYYPDGTKYIGKEVR